jgi:elongation factor G
MRLDQACLFIGIRPLTPDDASRLRVSADVLTAETSTVSFVMDDQSGEAMLGGTSEQHLETLVDRLKRQFGVSARIGRPTIAYRWGVARAVEGEVKYTGGVSAGGYYAHVKVQLAPAECGSGLVLEVDISGGEVPQIYFPAIEKGTRHALAVGINGNSVDDVCVRLIGGSYHDVDSSNEAFEAAAHLVIQDALTRAGTVCFEPIMRVDIDVPTEHVDEVVANILARRGVIRSRQDCEQVQSLRASVPLAELFGFGTDLRARTLGRGTCRMFLERYAPAPPDDDDRRGFVGAHLRPSPDAGAARIQLPEPDEPIIDDDMDDTRGVRL